MEIITVGGEIKVVDSEKLKVSLIDLQGKVVEIDALGIEKISTAVNKVTYNGLEKLFSVTLAQMQRPVGEVNLLIGMQYAAFHPVRVESSGHLLLLRNRFGYVVAGSHPNISEDTKVFVKHATVLHTMGTIEKFYDIEGLGVVCQPKCGSCK